MRYLSVALFIIVVFIFCIIIMTTHKPLLHDNHYTLDETSTIFVSVPSYRDVMCTHTIQSAFANAKFPNRIVIGACEQNASSDESCVTQHVQQGIVRLISIPYHKARGPCIARYMCYTLYQDEDLYLQVDSHTRFSKDWDVKCTDMANQGPFPIHKCVYSTHPIDVDATDWENHEPSTVRDATWSDSSSLMFQGKFLGHGFKTSRQIGGGFLLTHRDVIRQVPLDPNLNGLFNGEELLYSARLFTHGFHILAPPRNVVAHDYSYSSHKVPWEDDTFSWNENPNETDGVRRADKLLLGTLSDSQFGMGTQKTLHDFWDYIQIDYKNKIVKPWNVTYYNST